MPSTQRARSSVPLDQRSVVPSVPGVPAWGAVLIALVAALLGVVMDSIRGSELTATFASLYVIGCVAAVLAVRHRGLFTAIAQPPLIIFFGVPIAYQFLSDDSGASLKDIVLNVAIPLVNRFPLMIATTLIVLILGVGRLLVDKRPQRPPKSKPARERATRSSSADRRGRDARRTDHRRPDGGRPESGRSRQERGDEPKTSWPPSDPTRWSRGDNEGLSAQRSSREKPTRERPARESPPRRSERSAPSEPLRRRDRGDYQVPPAYDSSRRDDRLRGRSDRDAPKYDTPEYERPRRDVPRHQDTSRTPPRATGVRRSEAPEPTPYPAPRVRYRDRE